MIEVAACPQHPRFLTLLGGEQAHRFFTTAAKYNVNGYHHFIGNITHHTVTGRFLVYGCSALSGISCVNLTPSRKKENTTLRGDGWMLTQGSLSKWLKTSITWCVIFTVLRMNAPVNTIGTLLSQNQC